MNCLRSVLFFNKKFLLDYSNTVPAVSLSIGVCNVPSSSRDSADQLAVRDALAFVCSLRRSSDEQTTGLFRRNKLFLICLAVLVLCFASFIRTCVSSLGTFALITRITYLFTSAQIANKVGASSRLDE
jgi:hypothetical protein